MKLEASKCLPALADKYEKADFCKGDPSQFLRHYEKVPKIQIADTELAAFIAAMLAFGSRAQFIPKIQSILQQADAQDGSISLWLSRGSYRKSFAHGDKKFYRFYSYDDMQTFFDELAEILKKAGSLGQYFQAEWEGQGKKDLLADIISLSFPKSRIVPKGRASANKRIHMFLRWMVRRNSPVDLGIWSWYPQSRLLLPLDVHVMQEAVKLGLLEPAATASRKTAMLLTKKMEEIFPGDPCRADYALFGLGVSVTGA